MSELKQKLRSDMTAAMKARDALTLGTLRMALAAITNEEVAGSTARELTDAEVGAFAAVARMLDPSERHAWVGADILVDEARSGFELKRGDATAIVSGVSASWTRSCPIR